MISEPPWLDGLSRIWRVQYDKYEATATVGFWLVHAPWMHLAWSWHIISVVHLRPMVGTEVKFQFEGATHEFMVIALDPSHEPTLDHKSFKYLRPVSITQQFICESDDDAKRLIEDHLASVSKGLLSLDSDCRSVWEKLLHSSSYDC